jgi:hypothetical protein
MKFNFALCVCWTLFSFDWNQAYATRATVEIG